MATITSDAFLRLLKTYDLETLETIARGEKPAPEGVTVTKTDNALAVSIDKLSVKLDAVEGTVVTISRGGQTPVSPELFTLKLERRAGGDGQLAAHQAAEQFDPSKRPKNAKNLPEKGIDVALQLAGTNHRPGPIGVVADPALNPSVVLRRAELGEAGGLNAVPAYTPTQGGRASQAAKLGRVGYLDLFAKLDGAATVGMLDVLEQRSVIDSIVKNKDGAAPSDLGRSSWLPLAQSEKTGPLLRDAINSDVARRSDALKDKLDVFAADGGKPYWPEIILGSGPQGANYAFTKAQTDPQAGMLVIEASDELGGGNFAKIGDGFFLNSSNRPQTGARPKAGTPETINPMASPVTPNDLSGRRWGEATTIATATSVSIAASGADVLMQERIENVSDRDFLTEVGQQVDWPGRYAVRLSSGRTVYTDRLVVAAGLGTEANLDGFDASCRDFLKSELDKVDPKKPNEVPRVVTVPDMLELAMKSQNGRAPYREGTTAFIGPGDGTRVVLEYLHGLGPESAYTGKGRLDTAQSGVIGENVWFVGQDGPRSCNQYKDTTRPRYAQIQALLKAQDGNTPRVQLAGAYVQKIEPITEGPDAGRIRLTYAGYDVGDEVGAYYDTFTKVVDRVVLGTGYERDVGAIFRGVLGREAASYKNALEDVRGKPRSFEEEVVVARRLKSSPGVCFIGPAAGQLPDDKELAGIKQNAVGLFANTPRTERFAELTAAEGAPRAARFVQGAVAPVKLAAGENGVATIAKRQAPTGMDTTGDNGLAVKASLAAALDGFAFAGKLELRVGQRGEELQLTAPGLNNEATAALARVISEEPGLSARLEAMSRRSREVEIAITGDDKGKLQMKSLKVNVERVARDPNAPKTERAERKQRVKEAPPPILLTPGTYNATFDVEFKSTSPGGLSGTASGYSTAFIVANDGTVTVAGNTVASRGTRNKVTKVEVLDAATGKIALSFEEPQYTFEATVTLPPEALPKPTRTIINDTVMQAPVKSDPTATPRLREGRYKVQFSGILRRGQEQPEAREFPIRLDVSKDGSVTFVGEDGLRGAITEVNAQTGLVTLVLANTDNFLRYDGTASLSGAVQVGPRLREGTYRVRFDDPNDPGFISYGVTVVIDKEGVVTVPGGRVEDRPGARVTKVQLLDAGTGQISASLEVPTYNTFRSVDVTSRLPPTALLPGDGTAA